jgi:hypothetical protein
LGVGNPRTRQEEWNVSASQKDEPIARAKLGNAIVVLKSLLLGVWLGRMPRMGTLRNVGRARLSSLS